MKNSYFIDGKVTQVNSDTLYDLDTNDALTPEDLGITQDAYDALCEESDNTGTPEGIVTTNTGRRVYAST